MTACEIFEKINNRMIEAEMFHSQMAEYWNFFGYLNGFKRLHEYRMFCEIKERRKLTRYFIDNFNRLIPNSLPANPEIIPSSFYSMSRDELNGNSKSYIKNGIEKWYEWGLETRNRMTVMYNELCDLNELSAAEYVACIIKNVDKEIKKACKLWLKCKALEYDVSEMINIQDCLHEKYRKKTEKLKCI